MAAKKEHKLVYFIHVPTNNTFDFRNNLSCIFTRIHLSVVQCIVNNIKEVEKNSSVQKRTIQRIKS